MDSGGEGDDGWTRLSYAPGYETCPLLLKEVDGAFLVVPCFCQCQPAVLLLGEVEVVRNSGDGRGVTVTVDGLAPPMPLWMICRDEKPTGPSLSFIPPPWSRRWRCILPRF